VRRVLRQGTHLGKIPLRERLHSDPIGVADVNLIMESEDCLTAGLEGSTKALHYIVALRMQNVP
jgi:hypothetical protein